MNIVEYVAAEVGSAVADPLGGRVVSGEFEVRTTETNQLVDVTSHVGAVASAAAHAAGIALVSVPHTTCALLVNEDEPGFREDLRSALERLVPRDRGYVHDRAPHDGEDESPNGYAHVRAALLNSHAILLPVRDGALALGRWQRVFLLELDKGRPRRVQVTLLGAPVP